MTKRQLFLVAGTLVLAACGTGTGPCETDGLSAGENRGRDQVNFVECTNVQRYQPTQTPAPKVGESGSGRG